MRVWFDHQIFGVQRFGGYTRYFLSLARALASTGRCQPLIVAPANVSGMLGPSDAMHWASWRLDGLAWTIRFRPSLVAPCFRLLSALEKPQVVHETHHLLSGSHVARGCRVVSTCHDLIPERLATETERSRKQMQMRRLAFERADRIICVSENTRADFSHYYPALSAKACVVHHGVGAIEPVASDQAPRMPERYVLYVGPRGGYKNFVLLAQAFAQLPRHHRLALLCFGASTPSPAEREHWRSLGLQDSQLQHTAGDDAWLARCYTQAQCLVYPSTMEGFGMPLTEAMAQGCPVLCSDIAVFREVCGDAAMYFDPLDAESLSGGLSALLEQPERARALSADGALRAARFSWQRCAEETLACYEASLQT
jgi:glycosyltransferase involved in cell wall biosynthesis